MSTWSVPVENRKTGEERVVEVEAQNEHDAKVAALHLCFSDLRWHFSGTTAPPVQT